MKRIATNLLNAATMKGRTRSAALQDDVFTLCKPNKRQDVRHGLQPSCTASHRPSRSTLANFCLLAPVQAKLAGWVLTKGRKLKIRVLFKGIGAVRGGRQKHK